MRSRYKGDFVFLGSGLKKVMLEQIIVFTHKLGGEDIDFLLFPDFAEFLFGKFQLFQFFPPKFTPCRHHDKGLARWRQSLDRSNR